MAGGVQGVWGASEGPLSDAQGYGAGLATAFICPWLVVRGKSRRQVKTVGVCPGWDSFCQSLTL